MSSSWRRHFGKYIDGQEDSNILTQLVVINLCALWGHHLTSLLPSLVCDLLLRGWVTEIAILGVSIYRLSRDRAPVWESTYDYYRRVLLIPLAGLVVSRWYFWLILTRPDYTSLRVPTAMLPLAVLYAITLSPFACWTLFQPVMSVGRGQSLLDWLCTSLVYFYRNWSYFVGYGLNYTLYTMIYHARGDVGLVATLLLLLWRDRGTSGAHSHVPHRGHTMEEMVRDLVQQILNAGKSNGEREIQGQEDSQGR